jgi:Rrf2 family iron-sulfur cluster assembly transcriptional regulator
MKSCGEMKAVAKNGMHLTSGADYGLRGLLYLAKQPPERLVVASEIAEAENMPEYFFSKIFQALAKAGLVHSVRGSNGGFSLARPLREITVLEAIEAIEGPITMGKCVDAPETCEKSDTCPFHHYLKEGKASLTSVFGKYTLADALLYAEAAKPSL